MIRKLIDRVRLLVADPRYIPFYLQRRVMNPAARQWIASRVARRLPSVGEVPKKPEVAQVTNELATYGIAMLGKVLTPEQCDEVQRYFAKREVFDSYRPNGAHFLPLSEARYADTHVAHHRSEDILRAPYLLALANDARITAIASEFLGCKPTIGYLAAWWSFNTPLGPQQAEFFHRDVDDWKFLKFFIYLTDVEDENGPHVYVRQSARSDLLARIGRFSDQQVTETFGSDSVMTIRGERGTAFLEDTFGIHKGQAVDRGVRLAFQVVYSLKPLPYSPKAPVLSRACVEVPLLDEWTNRVYLT
jgi:hypothetical protein